MQIVISHAWTWDEAHADRYVELSDSFNAFLAAQPGFIARTLVRDVDDPTHLVNLRVFTSVADYETMTGIPEYQDHIAALSEHVDPAKYEGGYVRQYADIASTTVDEWRPIS